MEPTTKKHWIVRTLFVISSARQANTIVTNGPDHSHPGRYVQHMRIRVPPLLLLASPFVLPVFVAYLRWVTVGLPTVPLVAPPLDIPPTEGFPPGFVSLTTSTSC
jgi:hypothetical protein